MVPCPAADEPGGVIGCKAAAVCGAVRGAECGDAGRLSDKSE